RPSRRRDRPGRRTAPARRRRVPLSAGGRETMKALLAWHDRPFRKTHDLVELGAACVAVDPTLEPHLRGTAPLTEYAWRYRYPGEPSEPEDSEVREALSQAQAVVALVLRRLPSETHPEVWLHPASL